MYVRCAAALRNLSCSNRLKLTFISGRDEVLQQFYMLIECSMGFTEVGFVGGKGRW